MRLYIQQATLVAHEHPHHLQKVDMLIHNGTIEALAPQLSPSTPYDLLVQHPDLHVSAGWCDIGAVVGEPGLEHRESLDSLCQAAAAGGYTTVACYPNTQPVVQSKAAVQYIRNTTAQHLVSLYAIGAVTTHTQGKDFTEMYDMYRAGAIAFSDGIKPIQDGGIMMRSLLYVKPLNGVIINHPHDHYIAADGEIHEGIAAVEMGLKGIPPIAEHIMLQRDIYLAEYTQSRVHAAHLSHAHSAHLVRQAKLQGIQITASVNPMNLYFTDTDLYDFDANLKVMPPVRTSNDQYALAQAVHDGTIDIISSNHQPLDTESKNLEFPYAEYGAAMLETAFATAHTALRHRTTLEILIAALSYKPRRIFNLPVPPIAVGELANLTFFAPNTTWTVRAADICSKGINNPMLGKTLTGKVIGVVANGQYHFQLA